MIKYLILSLVAFGIGIWLLLRFWKKHKRINTESIAVVKEIIDLGRGAGAQKMYAIKYEVQSSEPFELLVTPVTKKPQLESMKVIFYEKEDPKKNYFFKTIGQFDRRAFAPSLLTILSGTALVGQIVSLIS